MTSSSPNCGTSAVNQLALNVCLDEDHVIRFYRSGGIQAFTLADLDRRALKVARKLLELGIRPGDRVGVMGSNRVEWVILDLAILKVGATTAGFEPDRFKAEDLIQTYALKVLFGEGLRTEGVCIDIAQAWAWSHSPDVEPVTLPLHRGYDSADVFAIRLTSGSTGQPKGLEVTVGSVDSSLSAATRMFGHGPGDNILVFLPLGHSLQQRYWVYSAFVNRHDTTVSHFDEVLAAAKACAPTVIMGVPGFYEQWKNGLEATHGALPDRTARHEAIQDLLGGSIRYLWTGSAPCSPAVLEFYNGCGVPLFEGYGLTETCIVAKNHPGAYKVGSVGKVLPDKAVRFDKDGVLVVRSKYPVNSRYTWCSPGDNEKMFLATAEVRTQDLGHVDAEGYLFIHGRVDDVLVMNSGLNVLVRPIEEYIRSHPDVHEVVLYGHGRPFLTAIVSPASPNPDAGAICSHIETWTRGCRPEERIHAVVLAAHPFSIDDGSLTMQRKPVRRRIFQRHAERIERAYAASVAGTVVQLVADEEFA